MTLFYAAIGLMATLIYGRVFVRRWSRLRLRRDARARRELMTALAFLFVAGGLLATTMLGWLGAPVNLRLVVGAMTVGAFVAAAFVFDQEDASDG